MKRELFLVPACLVFASCGEKSYDECMLENAGPGTSDYAVEVATDSCRRLSETAKESPLDAKISNERPSYSDGRRNLDIEISNPGVDVVTLVDVALTETVSVRFDVWIEPGRWVVLPYEIEPDSVLSELEVGRDLEAMSVKVIPSS